jgi:hypothetical protein
MLNCRALIWQRRFIVEPKSSTRKFAPRLFVENLIRWFAGEASKNKITIYRTIIRPAMMYSVAVWGKVAYTQLQKLQVVQNKFLRAAFNAPWFVRNAQLHREAKSSNHQRVPARCCREIL